MEWKSHVVQLLEKRDVTQDHPFAELISKCKFFLLQSYIRILEYLFI